MAAKSDPKSTSALPSKPPVLFFDGDKGGIGKSTLASVFADFLVKSGIPTAVVDADNRNPDVSRMFSNVVPTINANLRQHEGWMDLTDFLISQADRVIVVSLPAGIGEHFEKEATQFFNTIAQLGREASVFWLMDRVSDCVNLFARSQKVVGSRMKASIVVKNLFRGDADKFGDWDNSETRKAFDQAGGLTINLTELNWRARAKLLADHTNVMPFSNALVPIVEASRSTHGLTPSENMELDEWLRVNHGTFERLRSVIGV